MCSERTGCSHEDLRERYAEEEYGRYTAVWIPKRTKKSRDQERYQQKISEAEPLNIGG